MSETLGWLILVLPLLAFVLTGLVFRPLVGSRTRVAAALTILSIGAAFLLSVVVLRAVLQAPNHHIEFNHAWLAVGPLTLSVGLLFDPLTAVMLIVVSGVSLLIQIYSLAYMKDDPSYARFFAYMALFTASMLGLVLANNLLMVYAFWELVGLCSYLLIGFWFHKPSAAAAAKKAFLVTRLGDFGFLAALVFTAVTVGTLNLGDLNGLAEAGKIGAGALTVLALGVFAGAVGKSGQFPLHVWLPDAMEGPTPVSALIHAATMVAAGVFLVGRLFPLFSHSPDAMQVVAITGGFTAIFAASMGLVVNDIKRVMAYSTVSQLGYMMMSLGLGGYVAAIFHLFNHAFFKALLFMGAGSVSHTAGGTFNMQYMGGLRKAMPWTFTVLMVASLSLSGIPPFSGFWSKDEILAQAWARNPVLFWMALAAAFMTAFYVFRMMFLTFAGAYRGGAEAEQQAGANPALRGTVAQGAHDASGHASAAQGHGERHGLHESPWVMVAPMALLAVPALLSGLVNVPFSGLGVPAHWLGDFMGEGKPEAFNMQVSLMATVVSLAGIGAAYVVYGAKWLSAESLGRAFRPVYILLSRRYFIDDLYEKVLVGAVFYGGVCRVLDWFDHTVVDGAVNGVGWVGRNTGRGVARIQTGQLQASAAGITVGLVVIVVAYLLLARP